MTHHHVDRMGGARGSAGCGQGRAVAALRGAGGLSIPRPCLWAMSAMSDAEYTSATALSLVNVKVAMMIGMCIPLTRSLPEANWQEGHTMPERRAHEPVPENENTCRVYSHIIGPIHVPAGTESSRARPGGTSETRDGPHRARS